MASVNGSKTQTVCLVAAVAVIASLGMLVSAQDQAPLPFLETIPQTSFSCNGRGFGFYADVEANCQVFHICSGTNNKWSMLCPNQTMFNQQYLVCDYPWNVDCQGAEQFFIINERIGNPQAKLIDDK